ncbi:MAG: sodium:calcium antiporter [Alphaproteobacteria bacterium CG11_big_fil_rev_8_21_14_0_20_39_49]|nr:MAG: sodium:calcium antiporter [Alphaproteobacteria bacterium CG11_big_fil_rev_8_21_14_0_20_39_49]
MDYILIISGLVLLFAGGEALVRGSVAISERLGISAILIGVVVVGFGTSTPELMVSVKASLAGQPDIALGNVVGSNIANVLLILGISAIICPVICDAKAIRRDALAVLGVSVLLFVLTFTGSISAITGAIMIALLIVYIIYSYKAEMRDKKALKATAPDTVHEHEAQEFSNKLGLGVSLLMSVVGITMLVFGADFLVEGASNIARQAGIPEAVIGLTLVAVGTSLPELATAISAAVKKNSDVIIGNVLGSNLFNILSILGITAIIKPVPLSGQIASFDVPLNLGVALLTLLIIYFVRRVSRMTGAIFLVSYVIYIVWLYTS